MKEGTYNTIKYWDNHVMDKHILREIDNLTQYLTDYGITELSYVDIGGNVGRFYDKLSVNFTINQCEIIEASKILSEYLEIKFKENPKVKIHNFGLSDEYGEFYFGDESIQIIENRNLDLTGDQNINLGLSAAHFNSNKTIPDNIKTIFHSSFDFLDRICQIPPKDLKMIKVDTENRDTQIVLNMKDYFLKHGISPIILFENNFRYFMTIEDAQYKIDEFCETLGYNKVFLSKSGDNVFLLPLKK